MPETQLSLGAKLRRAAEQLPYLPRALALVWTATRRQTLLWLSLLLVQGVLPAVSVRLTRSLVNGLTVVVGQGAHWATVGPVLVPALSIVGVILAGELLRLVTGWTQMAQAELVGDHISALIHAKSVAVDLAFYESATYFDRLHRARSEAPHRPVALLENLGSLLRNTVTLAAMSAVLLPYGLWVPLALAISTLPALVTVMRERQRQHRWRRRTTSDERRTWYYDWLLTARDTAAELRLFDLGQRFRDAYQDIRRRLRTERLALTRREGVAKLAAGSSALLVAGAAMAWMVRQALQGLATLGDLALFYQAFNQGQGLMRSLLENLGEIYGNSLFLSDLFEFLALEPQVMDPTPPASFPARPAETTPGPSISFQGVSFRYPGSERAALRDLDLIIPAGQIAAIVGANGAGKSTLIKLLCRFYDPEAGRVELDGLDLRAIPLAELRRKITVLFQEPVHYNAAVSENIAMGDVGGSPTADSIQRAAHAAGADETVERLPDGYQTLLGTWFEGGTDLSVGEWQRVALARAFLRQAPIIVLDEPTSAMDSWAEADWLGRFRELAAGRTALIITHRFTTAICADVIHVMHDGQIIESGNHGELLELNGRYAQSWLAQTRDPVPTCAAKSQQEPAGSRNGPPAALPSQAASDTADPA